MMNNDIKALCRIMSLQITDGDIVKAEELLDWAYQVEKDENPEDEIRINAERLYALYPSKCPIRGASTQKNFGKDMAKITKALETRTYEDLASIIKKYVGECTQTNTYIKNSSTFWANIPEYDDNTMLFTTEQQTSNKYKL